MNEHDVLAERFEAERTRLRAVAFRMLAGWWAWSPSPAACGRDCRVSVDATFTRMRCRASIAPHCSLSWSP
jgi:hypothetical protein